jgi:hypothetical protein
LHIYKSRLKRSCKTIAVRYAYNAFKDQALSPEPSQDFFHREIFDFDSHHGELNEL